MKTRSYSGWMIALAGFVWTAAAAQAAGQELRLPASPLFEIGRSDVDLHRVAGAAIRADGSLVVADGGNRRILVFSQRGQLLREFGRAGDGPSEFRSLSNVWVAGDTIMAYDGLLNRITVWRPDGTLADAVAVPSYSERPIFIQAALSAWQYVGIVPPLPGARPGLRLDSSEIMVVSLGEARGAVRQIGTLGWSYTYNYVQRGGLTPGASTGYRTPFLGVTYLRTAGDYIAIIPRGTARVEVWRADGSPQGGVTAPIPLRPFTRDILYAYRDSMIEAARPSADRNPGNIDRIRESFGEQFPMPAGEFSPVVRHAVTVGGTVWLQALAQRGSSTTSWYMVDVERRRLVGSVVLPVDWVVLGGDSRRVAVLRHDQYDVQYIQVYDISGWGLANGT